MPRSRSKFDEFCSGLATLGGEYWLWPGSQGVLSDVPSTQSFLRGQANGPFRLFLDAASLLTREMLPKADDHLERILAALGSHEALAGVLLANIEAGGDLEGVRLSPLSRGVLRPRLLVELWRSYCPKGTPVVLLEERFEEQAALLGA